MNKYLTPPVAKADKKGEKSQNSKRKRGKASILARSFHQQTQTEILNADECSSVNERILDKFGRSKALSEQNAISGRPKKRQWVRVSVRIRIKK